MYAIVKCTLRYHLLKWDTSRQLVGSCCTYNYGLEHCWLYWCPYVFFFLVYILWCITEILVKLFLSHQLNQARSCQNANGSINMPSAIIRLMPWYRSVNLMVVLNHSSVICHTVSVLTAMEIKNQTPVLMSDMEHQYAMTQVWMWELLC